jgi:hypothetical protein
MNIFFTDTNAKVAAISQPDKMLVKMVLETAQMLCTAHRVLDGNEYADEVGLYKEAYKNHPCTVWARESSTNYDWLFKHFTSLLDEYEYRYNKEHACKRLVVALSKTPDNITQTDMTPVALAMPDQYKKPDPVLSYRDYVIHEKHYAKWEKGRAKPIWWNV